MKVNIQIIIKANITATLIYNTTLHFLHDLRDKCIKCRSLFFFFFFLFFFFPLPCLFYFLNFFSNKFIKFRFFFFFFFFLVFFIATLTPYEVPGLGDEWELQLQAYTTAMGTVHLSLIYDLCPSLWQHWILNHWVRPGIEPSSSQTLYQVLNPLSHNRNSPKSKY